MRKAVLHLVFGIVVLDAVALAIYYFAGIEHAEPRTRMIFTFTWTIVTLLVVVTLLKRVRKLRYSRFNA
jgi:hypothetical protein